MKEKEQAENHSSYVGRHRLVEESRVAYHFHRDFVSPSELLKEARQLFQTPLTQVIPCVLQAHAAGKIPAVQIDPDRALFSLIFILLCFFVLARRSRRVLRRPPFSYPRSFLRPYSCTRHRADQSPLRGLCIREKSSLRPVLSSSQLSERTASELSIHAVSFHCRRTLPFTRAATRRTGPGQWAKPSRHLFAFPQKAGTSSIRLNVLSIVVFHGIFNRFKCWS